MVSEIAERMRGSNCQSALPTGSITVQAKPGGSN